MALQDIGIAVVLSAVNAVLLLPYRTQLRLGDRPGDRLTVTG
jgi:hypothetical protein